MRTFLVGYVLMMCLSAKEAVVAAELSGPWSVSERAPCLSESNRVADGSGFRGAPDEVGGTYAYIWLRVYQNYFSVVMTSHCPLYPSCSNYSIEAVRRYGAFRGMTLTADRLIHEWTEALEAPVITIGGKMSCYDPVPGSQMESTP